MEYSHEINKNEFYNFPSNYNPYTSSSLGEPSSGYMPQGECHIVQNQGSDGSALPLHERYSSRGRRKQRRKSAFLNPSKSELPITEISDSLCLTTETDANDEPFNNDILDQVLSQKKMLLMQSPEVMEFFKKCIENKNK